MCFQRKKLKKDFFKDFVQKKITLVFSEFAMMTIQFLKEQGTYLARVTEERFI